MIGALARFQACMAEAGYPMPHARVDRATNAIALGSEAVGHEGDPNFWRVVYKAFALASPNNSYVRLWCADHFAEYRISHSPVDFHPAACECHSDGAS